MDDQLQRRLEAADPLADDAASIPEAERLDAIAAQVMAAGPAPRRSILRPRAIGLVGATAGALVVVLVGGSLLRPSSAALAWDPSPSAVSDAQRAAATAACEAGLPGAVGESGTGVQMAPGPIPSGLPEISVDGGASVGGASVGGGAVSGSVSSGAGPVTVTSGDGPVPPMPPMPDKLPPLIGLELHGTGGVAIFADAKTTAYCLLVKDGDKLTMAGLLFPDLGNGVSAGVGTIVGATGSGPTTTSGMTSGMVSVDPSGLVVSAMTTAYKDQSVGIIAGTAPGAEKVVVVGGPADGATATVAEGRYAMWAPGDFLGKGGIVKALDAAGKVLATQDLAAPPAPPMVTSTTKP